MRYKKTKKGGMFTLAEFDISNNYIRTIYFDSARQRSDFIKYHKLNLF